jgi:hypothetical protein
MSDENVFRSLEAEQLERLALQHGFKRRATGSDGLPTSSSWSICSGHSGLMSNI